LFFRTNGDNAQEFGRMKSVTRWLFIVMMGGCAIAGLSSLRAQEKSEAKSSSLAAEEREACIKNLKSIYESIEAYQRDHKDLPNWLSDLVPKYITDTTLFTCPVCRRTGKIEPPPLADPNISSSYLFEFCPLPLGSEAPNAPTRTRREWKRRQMGVVGSVVPVVRCRHHNPVLNVAFDGRVYESPGRWETMLTNRVNPDDLTAAKMFANEPAPPAAAEPVKGVPAAPQFPIRDAKARKELLDLSPFYNARLSDSWHGGAGNDLAELPPGLQTIAGLEFDVRGLVQLRSRATSAGRFPPEIKGIKVRQKCQRLNFLHAAGFGNVTDEGKQIGAYIVHFAANQIRMEIPIKYGRDVRNWHSLLGEPPPPADLQLAWKGSNEISKKVNSSIRLFLTTWTNLVTTVPIDTIDFVSSTNTPAPFLIAITTE
jgi:hypothetical protein